MSLDQRFVEHIVQSIETQVGLLHEAGRLSAEDTELIKAKARNASSVNPSVSLLNSSMSAVSLGNSNEGTTGRAVPPIPTKPGSLRSDPLASPSSSFHSSSNAPPAPVVAAASEPQKQLARALWDYSSSTPGDLSFTKGQTVEILREENEHWFFGRCGVQEGLFPSNYVERIQAEAPAQPAAPRAVPPPPPQQHHMPPTSMSMSHGAPPPPMYGAEKGGYYQPPPAPPQQHFYNPPPQPPMSSYAPPPPPMIAQVEPQKEGRFGGFGKTMAHGAAGGAGFGLASQAVQSIF